MKILGEEVSFPIMTYYPPEKIQEYIDIPFQNQILRSPGRYHFSNAKFVFSEDMGTQKELLLYEWYNQVQNTVDFRKTIIITSDTDNNKIILEEAFPCSIYMEDGQYDKRLVISLVINNIVKEEN